MTSPGGGDFPCCAPTEPEWDDRDYEREHDCCPRCGRGSCRGSGSGGWDDCEHPVWISLHAVGRAPEPPSLAELAASLRAEAQAGGIGNFLRSREVEVVARWIENWQRQPVIADRNEATRTPTPDDGHSPRPDASDDSGAVGGSDG